MVGRFRLAGFCLDLARHIVFLGGGLLGSFPRILVSGDSYVWNSSIHREEGERGRRGIYLHNTVRISMIMNRASFPGHPD